MSAPAPIATATSKLTSDKVDAGAEEVGEALQYSPDGVEDARDERYDDVEEGLEDGQDGLDESLEVRLGEGGCGVW